MENEVAAEEETEPEEYDDLPGGVAVSALDEEAQRNFLRYLIDLERRSDYLIPPYIVSHLLRDSVLPSLSQSQLRSLVRDAVAEGILEPSTYTVVHRQTGRPHDLRTLRMNLHHPLVESVAELEPTGAVSE
jgi:hypothetical protein